MTVQSVYPVLMTADVAAAAAFYTVHFPFEVTFETDWYVSLKVRQGTGELALLAPTHPTIPPAFRGGVAGGLLLNGEVDDVDAVYTRLQEAGLPVHLALRAEDFGQRHFITSGPDGVLIDVIQPVSPSDAYAERYDPRRGRP